MAEAQRDRLTRYINLAAELESSSAVQQRSRDVDAREQIYWHDWRWRPPKDSEIQRVVDTTPETVADRAISKLTSMEPAVVLRSDLMPEAITGSLFAAHGGQDASEFAKAKAARKRLDDTIENTIWQLLTRMDRQRNQNIIHATVRGGVVTGYAGPIRVCYDEDAALEPGSVPLYAQSLDPRCYLEIPGYGAGTGPRLVIYKRQASRQVLQREGWDLGRSDAGKAEPEAGITVFDVWEKESTGGMLKLWHSIIADGGQEYSREFVKKPVDMHAARGIWRIPYVFVPTRPANYVHDSYPQGIGKGFLDVLVPNYQARCFLLTAMSGLVQKALDPPRVVFSNQSVDLNARDPGAQTDLDPTDKVQLLNDSAANREITTLAGSLEHLTQRGTFSAAVYGEGAEALSGIMTGRLQSAGSETIVAEQQACERALGDLLGIIAMFANAYHLPGFTGNEIFEVKLPGMTRGEQAQLASAYKNLSDPRPDGSRFISDDSARELAMILPGDHEEADKIRNEQWDALEKERIKEEIAKRAQAREQNILDMQAQAKAQAGPDPNAQRALASEQQDFLTREMGMDPNSFQQPPALNGNAPMPIGTPQQALPQMQWNPAQPEPAVGG